MSRACTCRRERHTAKLQASPQVRTRQAGVASAAELEKQGRSGGSVLPPPGP